MTDIFDHGTYREAIASVFVAQTSLSEVEGLLSTQVRGHAYESTLLVWS